MTRHRFFLLAFSLVAASLAGAQHNTRTVTNSVGMKMVSIAPGSFEMGSDAKPLPAALLNGKGIMSNRSETGDFDEHPSHKVTLTHRFLIGETEVTIDQFRQFRPDYKGNPTYAPYATGVSWDDAMEYCKWLSKKEGKPYRLPTEAEWEYVARAGTNSPFSSGDEPPAAGTPNAWGVEDMHSSPAEWTLDWYGPYSPQNQIDPVGLASGIAKVVRGGGLDYRRTKPGEIFPANLPFFARSANRASMAPSFRGEAGDGVIGFRIVQAPMPKTRPEPYQPLFFQTAVKKDAVLLKQGPNSEKPFYHTHLLFPDLGTNSMPKVGWKLGLAEGLGVAYHNSAVQELPNGDLLAAYYNTPDREDDPDQTVLIMRRRHGSETWDMPEPWPYFADAANAAPVIWNDKGKVWLFWGSPRLIGAYPFQYTTSMDNGVTWSEVQFPNLQGPVGRYVSQPINSVVRAKDGTIYLPTDATGGGSISAVWATSDDGKTWRDTGGRTAGRHTTLVIGKDGSLLGFGGKNSNIDGFMPLAISKDGGKTYEKVKTQFPPLGSGQRPSVIRLASGRLFFVADLNPEKKMKGPHDAGSFVALSDDDGKTWTTRRLPELLTVGYVTAAQGANGIIHIVTSKNKAGNVEIELNESWVLQGGAAEESASTIHEVKNYHESYANGKPKAAWSAGIGDDGRYLLEGKQTIYYRNGQKQWETNYHLGFKTGTETFWSEKGAKLWEKTYGNNGEWTWRLYGKDGKVTAESNWKNKTLVQAKLGSEVHE